MKIRIPAVRLTIYVSNGDLWHHRPLVHEIIRRAREAGLNGASSFTGMAGFGASSTVHSKSGWKVGSKYPIAIIIVDEEKRIREFLPTLDELIVEGVVTLEDCEMVRYYRDGHG